MATKQLSPMAFRLGTQWFSDDFGLQDDEKAWFETLESVVLMSHGDMERAMAMLEGAHRLRASNNGTRGLQHVTLKAGLSEQDPAPVL